MKRINTSLFLASVLLTTPLAFADHHEGQGAAGTKEAATPAPEGGQKGHHGHDHHHDGAQHSQKMKRSSTQGTEANEFAAATNHEEGARITAELNRNNLEEIEQMRASMRPNGTGAQGGTDMNR